MKKCKICGYDSEVVDGLCEECQEEEDEKACVTRPVKKRLRHARKVFGK